MKAGVVLTKNGLKRRESDKAIQRKKERKESNKKKKKKEQIPYFVSGVCRDSNWKLF